MRERIGRMIGDAVEGMPWLGTFHSIAAKMLRRHAELVGLQSNFTILDTDDQLRVLKQLIQARDSTRSAGPRANSRALSTSGRIAGSFPPISTRPTRNPTPMARASISTPSIRRG